jgi:hypothetical protein
MTGAALIILMIVLVPGLFRNLPQPALAAVVITASLSLADIPGTARLWRQRKAEFLRVEGLEGPPGLDEAGPRADRVGFGRIAGQPGCEPRSPSCRPAARSSPG